jgi:hypothetical protein
MSTPSWLNELEQQLASPNYATSETYSPTERFTPSHHPSSLSITGPLSLHSEEAMSTQHAPASAGSLISQTPDGLAPSHHSISEGPPFSPPENAKSLSENTKEKLKIAAGAIIVGGVIVAGGIAGSKKKHRDCQDS